MAKPPNTPPHSDITGADQDQVHNVDAAVAVGQDAETLKKHQERSIGRPDYSDQREKKNG